MVGSDVGAGEGGKVGNGEGGNVGMALGAGVGTKVGRGDGNGVGWAEGAGEGSKVGNPVGVFVVGNMVGFGVGEVVGDWLTVGAGVGINVGTEVGSGETVGSGEGTTVGSGVGVGKGVGIMDGVMVGNDVGTMDGAGVGEGVGFKVGKEVGTMVGSGVGECDGTGVGEWVGAGEGGKVGTLVGTGVGDAVGSGVGSGHNDKEDLPAKFTFLPAELPLESSIPKEIFHDDTLRKVNSTLRFLWSMGKYCTLLPTHWAQSSQDTTPNFNGSVGLSHEKPLLFEVNMVEATPGRPVHEVTDLEMSISVLWSTILMEWYSPSSMHKVSWLSAPSSKSKKLK